MFSNKSYQNWIKGIIVCLLMTLNASSQDVSQMQFGNDSGLPSQEVYSITVDKEGYIWAGTAYGLARFDGNRFKSFQYEGQKGSSFSGFAEDNWGRIWAHNFVGQIICIDGDQIELVKAYSDSIKISYAYFSIYEKQIIFAQGKDGLYKAKIYKDLKSMKFERIDSSFNGVFMSSNPSWGLISTNKTQFYASINPSTDEIIELQAPKKVTYRSGTFINKNELVILYNKPREAYRIKAIEEQAILDEKLTQLIKSIPANMNRIVQVGSFTWILSERGVFVLDGELNPIQWPMLKESNCTDVQIDRDGSFWISTLTDGVINVPNFEMITYSNSNSDLVESKISTLHSRNNKLYIGTSSGALQVYDFNSKRFDQTLFKLPFPLQYISVNPSSTQILFQTNNKLYSTTASGKINSITENSAIKMIDWISDSNYLVAGTGISKVNNLEGIPNWVKNIVQSKSANFEDNRILWKGNSTVTLVDSTHKAIWIGGRFGMYYLSEDETIELKNPLTDEPIYPSRIIQSSNGLIWIGSLSGDLFVFDDIHCVGISEANGVVNGSTVRAIIESNTSIWVATNLGLQKWKEKQFYGKTLNRSKKSDWLYFNQSDGLLSNEITGLAFFDKNLVLSTLNGLQVVNEDRFLAKMAEPTVRINQFLVNGILKSNDLHSFPHDSNRVQINVSGVSLSSGSNLQLAYRMLPIAQNWVFEKSNAVTIQFFDLQPGEYVFQVKSINKIGVESKEIKEIRFQILKPFWLRWWFLLISALFVSISSIQLVRFQIQKQRNKDREEQERNRLEDQLKISRLSAIQAQMNPHFMYNALNSIQHFIFTNDKRLSNRFLGKFADLMRLIMNHSTMESISLVEELSTIKTYLDLEKMRLEDRFDYEIKIDDDVNQQDVHIPPLLIQPYLENCIKHGFQLITHQGKISLSISKSDDSTLLLKIEDNGIGREKAFELSAQKKHTSFSTKANQHRIELLKSIYGPSIQIRFEDKKQSSEQESGTIVYLYLPILEG